MAGLDHLTLLAGYQDQFLATIPLVDPRAPVPACAPWRVRDLVEHLAQVHHWAAAQARDEDETALLDEPDPARRYAACAAELRTTLAAVGPDAAARTLVGPGPASFWHRRQLHETLVHLWDLRGAAGLDVEAPPAVWADAVDEVATVFQPRQVRLRRTPPLVRGVRLVADDVPAAGGAPRTWLLGAHQPDQPLAREDVVATGSARALALVVWRRRTPDEVALRVDGDPAALAAALAPASLTP